MAKNTYQTYTDETPMGDYRDDFIRRGAMCGAAGKARYPDLLPLASEANQIVDQIDARRAGLQKAEDDQTRARAIEDVEKLDVIDAYTELRRTMAVKGNDYLKILPDAPSALGRLGVKSFGERIDQAISNLGALPDGDPIKVAFLPKLQKEADELRAADKAEDATRAALHSGRVALTLYKSELSQAREVQLGAIQKILGDREKTAQFTLPWRKTSKPEGETEQSATAASPGAPATPPAP